MSTYGPSTVRRRRTNAELDVVDAAIVSIVAADAPMTLRGVYYRAVSAGVVDKTETAYRLVGRRLLKLRRAGVVDYSDITDGTRWISKPRSWSSVDQMLADAAASYRRALWRDQDTEVQVYTEKDAISGVIYPVTSRWDVPLGVVRGYSSETFLYNIAASIVAAGKPTVVYQLGDHDPSGLGAWQHFISTVTSFAPGAEIEFVRLAVTPAQIVEMNLPTRATKTTDTRARSFRGESVEVDAIPSGVLRQLIDDAISSHVDARALELTEIAEESERDLLYEISGGAS